MKETKARVLVIVTSLSYGGCERLLQRLLAVNKCKNRFTVRAVIYLRKSDNEVDLDSSIKKIGPLWGVGCYREWVELVKIVGENQYDVVNSWQYHSHIVGVLVKCAKNRKGLIWSVHYADPKSTYLKRKTRWIARVTGYLSGLAETIVYPSVTSMLAHSNAGFAREKGVIIENSPCLQTSSADRVETRRDSDKKIILCPTRDSPEKGIALGIRVAQMMSQRGQMNYQFVFIGSGVNKLAIPDESRNILLRGPTENMEELYQACVCVLVTSQLESFCNVIVEGLSYGKPVVTTAVGIAASENIEGMFIDKTNSANGLYRQLQVALEQKSRIAAMDNRDYIADRFGADRFYNEYVEAYERVSNAAN